jgi:hypothetical protein
VEENVAFQTMDDCFVVSERSSRITLRKNLGAQTKKRDGDTTSIPATFYIANAADTVVEGNVAAGSEGEGYQIRFGTTTQTTGSDYIMKDNTAHSNKRNGFNYTSISKGSLTLLGVQAYRNSGVGLSMTMQKENGSLIIEKGIFADNRGSIVVENARAVSINNVTLYGESPNLLLVENTQESTERTYLCTTDHADGYAGIKLSISGSVLSSTVDIRNVLTRGFFSGENVGNQHCLPRVLELKALVGSFKLSNIQSDVDEPSPNVNFCNIMNDQLEAFVVDRNSSLIPASSSSVSFPSSIVSEGHKGLTFIPPTTNQIPLQQDCSVYLPDTCLRTVVFSIDPTISTNSKEVILNICDRATMKNCMKYQATDIIYQDQYLDDDDTLLIDVRQKRYFVATLPDGRYQADFLNATTGKRVWPTHVVEHYSEVSCKGTSSGFLEEGSIWIPTPSFSLINSVCTSNLLRTEPQYWIGGIGDVGEMEVLPAISTTPMLLCEALPPPSWTIEQRLQQFIIGQYLDTRCLVEQQEYEIGFHIQLMHLSTEVSSDEGADGISTVAQHTLSEDCLSNGGSGGGLCPEVGILFTSHDGSSKWIHKLQYTTASASATASGESEPELMSYGDVSKMARPRSGGENTSATSSVSIESNGVYFIGAHDYDDPNERLRRSLRGNKDGGDEQQNDGGSAGDDGASDVGSDGSSSNSSSNSPSSPPSSTAPPILYSEANATTAAAAAEAGSNTFQFRGSFFLDYRMADASNAFFFIRRGNNNVDIYDSNRLCMDSLSIRAKV